MLAAQTPVLISGGGRCPTSVSQLPARYERRDRWDQQGVNPGYRVSMAMAQAATVFPTPPPSFPVKSKDTPGYRHDSEDGRVRPDLQSPERVGFLHRRTDTPGPRLPSGNTIFPNRVRVSTPFNLTQPAVATWINGRGTFSPQCFNVALLVPFRCSAKIVPASSEGKTPLTMSSK